MLQRAEAVSEDAVGCHDGSRNGRHLCKGVLAHGRGARRIRQTGRRELRADRKRDYADAQGVLPLHRSKREEF